MGFNSIGQRLSADINRTTDNARPNADSIRLISHIIGDTNCGQRYYYHKSDYFV